MIIILLGAINQCNGHSYYTKYYKYYTRVPKRTLYILMRIDTMFWLIPNE